MAQGVLQNGSADHAELGLGAGSVLAGSVILGRQCLQTVIVTADAAILHQTLAAAGGCGHFSAFIPRMAKSLGVVGNVAVLAAGAGIGGKTTFQAGRLGNCGNMVMAERIGVVTLIAELAVGAGVGGVAHGGAGCVGNNGLEVMLA